MHGSSSQGLSTHGEGGFPVVPRACLGGEGGGRERNSIYIPKHKYLLAAPTIINGGRRKERGERLELLKLVF